MEVFQFGTALHLNWKGKFRIQIQIFSYSKIEDSSLILVSIDTSIFKY